MQTFFVHATKERTAMVPLFPVSGQFAKGSVFEAYAPTLSGLQFESLYESQERYLVMRIDDKEKKIAFSHYEVVSIVSENRGLRISIKCLNDVSWRELSDNPADAILKQFIF